MGRLVRKWRTGSDVEVPRPAALALPSGAYEVPLVIRDANLDKMNTLTYNGRASGFLGNTPLVNGTLSGHGGRRTVPGRSQ